ncbi:helix-turn-helix domain-containing protein [Glycomyces tenuis]|uniref:helix-turn-helix domain-containing protein n=1 Tax=Glycomyces tenuis TaxID=58116 RepID=UPI000429FFF7|nr:AraC family transcriptional regulator [Glycomyces tenuis]
MRDKVNGEPWTPTGMPDLVLMASPPQAYRDNLHSELKLVWCSGGYEIERRGRRYSAGTEQLIALHAGEAHSGRPDLEGGAASEWRIICVPPTLVDAVADPDDLRFEPPVIDDGGIARLFRSVFDLFESPVSHAEQRAGLYELVAALTPFAAPAEAPSFDPVDDAALRRAQDHLSGRMADNVTLDELADVAKVNKFRLVRACTARFGLAPHTLHLRMRLDHARRLIRDGARLSDIAHATGFYDQAHFSRTFTRAFGLTPSAYRASWKGTGPERKIAPDLR